MVWQLPLRACRPQVFWEGGNIDVGAVAAAGTAGGALGSVFQRRTGASVEWRERVAVPELHRDAEARCDCQAGAEQGEGGDGEEVCIWEGGSSCFVVLKERCYNGG